MKSLIETAKKTKQQSIIEKASVKELRQAIEDALDDISEGDVQLAERRLRRVLGK